MNTIRSTWIGWGVLGVAGGGAYYFAKKQINADRATRHEAEMQRKARYQNLESSAATNNPANAKRKKASKKGGNNLDDASKTEMGKDGPEADQGKTIARSQYEAEEPYISRKGDRFS